MSSETENEVYMSRLTVGKKQRSTVEEPDHSREGNFLFILGTVVICVMLSVPMMNIHKAEYVSYDDAVPVMSSGVTDRDDTDKADLNTSTAEKLSIYDYIGEMFAELFFGDR